MPAPSTQGGKGDLESSAVVGTADVPRGVGGRRPRATHGHGKAVEMTKQASFKRRIRDRMAKTGERYASARLALIERSSHGGRDRAAEPELSDDALVAATGRSWDEWCDVVDEWPGHIDGHAAVAAHLQDVHDVDGWWAQTITVGWERITGRRLPHQRADGTFTAGRSRTIAIDADVLREMLLDEGERSDLFAGLRTELRSRPSTKTVRLGIGPGVAVVDLARRDDGRTVVTVAHQRLPEADDVVVWKAFWGEWLDALDEAVASTPET